MLLLKSSVPDEKTVIFTLIEQPLFQETVLGEIMRGKIEKVFVLVVTDCADEGGNHGKNFA